MPDADPRPLCNRLVIASQRCVHHVCTEFVERSMPWIYDIVTQTDRYRSVVHTQERLQPESFPFEAVYVDLPAGERGSPAWRKARARQAAQLLRFPANRWRSALRPLRDSLVHAHFGPVGWYCTDAGLGAVVTTFYGYDMSRLISQRRWRRGYRALFEQGTLFLAGGTPHARRAHRSGGTGRPNRHPAPDGPHQRSLVGAAGPSAPSHRADGGPCCGEEGLHVRSAGVRRGRIAPPRRPPPHHRIWSRR